MKRPSAGAVLVLLLAPAAQAQNLTTQQSLDLAVKIKTKVNDLAYAQCLASTDESRQSAISLNTAGLIKSLTGSLSLNDRKRVIRGAIDAPAAIRPVMDAHIRDCLQRRTPRIEQDLLTLAQQLQQPIAAAAGVPSVVALHFTYRRQASLDPRRYSENVRLNLHESATVINRNLAPQSEADSSPWFEHVYHPYPSGRVEGTITATPLNSRLTADQPPGRKFVLTGRRPCHARKSNTTISTVSRAARARAHRAPPAGCVRASSRLAYGGGFPPFPGHGRRRHPFAAG
ncbi:MAG TPA: hypothetical protein VJM79_02175 [Rhizorhapis sp.]|nr:hypothetical protein [Rhizorhapis sp.]